MQRNLGITLWTVFVAAQVLFFFGVNHAWCEDSFGPTNARRAGYDWWSLRPLTAVAPLAALPGAGAWNAHPVDRFIRSQLRANNLTPSPPAAPRVLIRRATYDLVGLPPTPEEVTAFLADCEKETGEADRVGDVAYAQLIERLLASPRYGEHWGRHWLDVVRFGESNGYERNVIIENAWPFRDYVIRSFNEDKPFDQLVLEHLAGDVIANDDPSVAVGATFLVCGPYDDVGNQDAEQAAQIRANTLDDMIRATSEAFLGLTIGCGRCHDHKFDPILQDDYYRMYATFAGVRHGDRIVASEEKQKERQAKLTPLHAKEAELNQEIADVNASISARAQSNAAEMESRWARPAVERKRTEERFSPVIARFVRLVAQATDVNPNAATGYTLDEFEAWTAGAPSRNVALAANGGRAIAESRRPDDFADAYSAKLTIDGAYGARWHAVEPTLTIEFARIERIDRVAFSSDGTGAAGAHPVAAFVCEYVIETSLDGETWNEVASSRDRKPANDAHRNQRLASSATTDEDRSQIAELQSELNRVRGEIATIPALPTLWIGQREQPSTEMHVFVGGNPQKFGAPVTPASLSFLSSIAPDFELTADAPESERRRALADWIVAPENALTARVFANRIWHYHFGTGIVDTPSDFGFMGGRPTHPELLDWLARQAQANGWRMKPLHRVIMLSQTYRQSSAARQDAIDADRDARMLWRFPPRRLSAEEIRDSILQVAGKLDLSMGGQGFRLFDYQQDNVATYAPLETHGPDTYRRAVYHHNARAARVDLMSEFDAPDCAFSAPRRATTTTPLQALTLLNHRFSLDMASALAERLESDADANASKIADRAYALLFSRPCDADERELALRFVKSHGLRAYCRALLNTNEFIYIE